VEEKDTEGAVLPTVQIPLMREVPVVHAAVRDADARVVVPL
jgi:hypothetical protein